MATLHTSPGVARVRDALEAHGFTTHAGSNAITSRCPLDGHEPADTDPSLSIQYDAKNEKARVRCHRSEHYDLDAQILGKISLKVADLYDQPRKEGQKAGAKKTKTAVAPVMPDLPPVWRPEDSLRRVHQAAQNQGSRVRELYDGSIILTCVNPGHEDRVPSLHASWVATKYGGRTLLHCPACGTIEQAEWAHLLGLEEDELFDDQRWSMHNRTGQYVQRTSAPTIKRLGPLPKRIAHQTAADDQPKHEHNLEQVLSYDYIDASNTLVQQVIRYRCTDCGGKTFSQRYRAEERWYKTEQEVPGGFTPVLYRHPQIVAAIAAGQDVWIVEGEKDAGTAAQQLEVEATTNARGASHFPDHLLAVFAGAHVSVVLDRDAAGWRRGVTLHQGLTDAGAATIRLLLPLVDEHKADLTDHVEAGHTAADLVEVPLEAVAAWANLGELQQLTKQIQGSDDEARAQLAAREEHREAGRTSKAEDAARFATRWAQETARIYKRARAAAEKVREQVQQVPDDVWALAALTAATTQLQSAAALARSIHGLAGHGLPEDLTVETVANQVVALAISAPESATAAITSVNQQGPAGEVAGGDEVPPTVVTHPSSDADVPAPMKPIPMGRGKWAYTVGDSHGHQRGVYAGHVNDGDVLWDYAAPLPYVQARIIRRDGTGRRTGTDYLLSVTPDGVGIVVDRDGLRVASWANELGMPLSADDKVQKATHTAIVYHAEEAPLREATPRVDNGAIAVPVPDTLPPGYLECSDATREGGLAAWAKIIELAARSPRMALVLGASAIAPFVAATQRQSHIVFLYGESAQGKTVTLQTAGSIWGRAVGSTGVLQSWNTTAQFVTRCCGDLGLLPPFYDEISQSPFRNASETGKFISDIAQGASRGAATRQDGYRRTRPWNGVFFSSGNGALTDGLGAGRHAGIHRRVVELGTPFALDEEHAEAFAPLCHVAYGHAGHELLARHTVDTVQPVLDRCTDSVEPPDNKDGKQVARHLHAHIAGAALLDEIAGTGTTLHDAAVTAAHEYLQQWAPPEHDADRLIDAIRDAMAREPAMWPTRSVYIENMRPRREFGDPGSDDSGTRIPQHGVDRSSSGIRDDAGVWVGVFAKTWQTMCSDLDIDEKVARRELFQRGILLVTESRRRKSEWKNEVKVDGKGVGVYQLALPEQEEDPDDDQPLPPPLPTAPTAEPQSPEPDLLRQPEHEPSSAPELDEGGLGVTTDAGWGSVGGRLGVPKQPLTCAVGGVGGNSRETSRVPVLPREEDIQELPNHERRDCVICRTPASHHVNDHPVHLGECFSQLQAHSAAETREAQPVEHHSAPADQPHRTEHADEPSPAAKPVKRPAGARFTAPAAVLTATEIHLPGGEVRPWDPATVRHWGQLALLTTPDRLALGWGGGETLPCDGQIWLTTDALERLGLPTRLPDEDKPRTKALEALIEHPMVAGALRDGWEIDRSGVNVWTRIWHPEHYRTGARIVALPWHRVENVGLFADNPHPAELADRLLRWARATGVAYRINPAAAGFDIINHFRPPRRDEDDSTGANRRRVAALRGGAELPPFLHQVEDMRFRNLETDFLWWRPFETLLDTEQAHQFVHAYDRNSSYFATWSGMVLGVDGLTHRTGDEAAQNVTKTPGYWLVDEWDWDHWGLPDPGAGTQGRVGDGKVWITTPTLQMLSWFEITPTVHESYTWERTSRYLEPIAKQLRPAMRDLDRTDPVLKTLKSMYSSTVGKFAQKEHYAENHLWRPDWRHHVIAQARLGILNTLKKVAETSGVHPLAVSHDLIVFASNDPDPISAWPGEAARLNRPGHPAGPGGWKPVGTADLKQWAPEHLPQRPQRFREDDAKKAMRPYLGGDQA